MRWFALLPAWLVVNLLAYFGAPLLGLIYENRLGLCDNGNASRVEPRLPGWLSWFQTPDNSLLGDAAWRNMDPVHWAWRAKLASWTALQAYLGRVGWLMRNPAYGFERSVLAASISATDTVVFLGDPFIHDGEAGKAGYCFVRIGRYWNLVWIKPLFRARCIYCSLGWNLKTYAERPTRMQTEPIAQYVFSSRFSEVFP